MQSLGDSQSARLVWQWAGHWYSLPITPSDVLTLARAVEFEGSPRESVAWALLQRAAYVRSHGKAVSIGKLIEQYAQPINPSWFPTGSKHLDEMARLARVGDVAGARDEAARAEVRISRARAPWESLSDETRGVVTGILRGESASRVPGAVHYWASHGPDYLSNQAKRPELVLIDTGEGFGKGQNVFFAEPGTRLGNVRVENGHKVLPGPDVLLAGVSGPGLLVASAVAALVWKWLT